MQQKKEIYNKSVTSIWELWQMSYLNTYALNTYALDTYALDTYALDTYALDTYALDTTTARLHDS